MFANVVRGILCLLLWLPLAARADGKVFSRAIAVKTTIPDQRALIHYADGTETLVIETSFIGAGTNFAWVVPVPSVPKVDAVSPGLFQNLELNFQPVVIHRVAEYYALILFVTVFGAFGGPIFQRASRAYPKSRDSSVVLLAFLFGLNVIIISVGVPSYVVMRGSSGQSTAAPAVDVVERKQVGVFSTVTLSSKDGSALVSWLNDNGFVTPTNVIPTITDYAQQGWFFVAAKVNRDTEAVGKAVPHPLAFTFKTEKPVYPLRLTGIENGACAIELYVFGVQRAVIPNFKVEHCRAPEYAVNKVNARYPVSWFPNSKNLQIRNPELRGLVKQSAVATKLTGKLSSAEMSKDAFISWAPFEAALPVLYTHEAAMMWAFNVFVATAISGWLLLAAWSRWIRVIQARWKLRVILLSGSVIAAWLMHFAIPKTDTVLAGGGQPSSIVFNSLESMIALAWLERDDAIKAGKHIEPLTFEELRRLAQATKYDKEFPKMFINPFTGQPLKHETTPGNILLRKSTNGVDCVWFDIDAVEHVLATFKE